MKGATRWGAGLRKNREYRPLFIAIVASTENVSPKTSRGCARTSEQAKERQPGRSRRDDGFMTPVGQPGH